MLHKMYANIDIEYCIFDSFNHKITDSCQNRGAVALVKMQHSLELFSTIKSFISEYY